MSEDQGPYAPPRAPGTGRPATVVDKDPRGSLGAGIGLFLLCLLGGGAVAWLLRVIVLLALPELTYAGPMFVLPMLLPWLVALALGARLAARGRTRTALGMLVGFGLLVAAALLLVAACFGIVAGMGGFG